MKHSYKLAQGFGRAHTYRFQWAELLVQLLQLAVQFALLLHLMFAHVQCLVQLDGREEVKNTFEISFILGFK